ncbi:MAG: hypothetical protein LBG70_04830, partial [Bifidobacteriaceae bacterium]|nr:hypothetical protein [Bifidobacteriaceae bacterium]
MNSAPPALDQTRWPVDPWALRETAYSAERLGAQETIMSVGNGYLGLRGNPEEGRDAHLNGTFINGFHETSQIRHAEEAYGFATTGQTIINVPDAKVIRIYVDDEPLLLSVADLVSYSRTLDFCDGQLVRELVWRTAAGKRVSIRSTRLVSLTERHLALMTYEFCLLDQDASVVISSQVLNRQDGANEYSDLSENVDRDEPASHDPRQAGRLFDRVLVPQVRQQNGGRYILGYRAARSGMTLAVGVDHQVTCSMPVEVEQSGVIRPDAAEHLVRLHAPVGCQVRLTKWVAYHSSRGVPAGELAARCERTLDRALGQGASCLAQAQHDWLEQFWQRSDVEVHGQPAIQQAVRWCLFQLAQATARAEGAGIPAKGVTGNGYSGHYFWDSEIFVLPFCTYTTPNLTRSALRFRYTMLDSARRRAHELSSEGALYPWRTINGEEASAYYAAGTAQYHIDADIAYALV